VTLLLERLKISIRRVSMQVDTTTSIFQVFRLPSSVLPTPTSRLWNTSPGLPGRLASTRLNGRLVVPPWPNPASSTSISVSDGVLTVMVATLLE